MEDRTEQSKLEGFNPFEPKHISKPEFQWRYGFYSLVSILKDFFRGPHKPKNVHERFSETAESIIVQFSDRVDSPQMLEASRALLEQQRIQDNSHARRRLERWATRTISWYLIVVAVLVVSNGIVSMFTHNHDGFISSGIMAGILSTTTINVIGLGFIVLKGHFQHHKEN